MSRTKSRTKYSFFLALTALILAGCASNPPLYSGAEDWRVKGKFSFRSDEKRESGNFDWRQSGQSYQVRLFGPLGFGAINISGDEQQISVQSARHQQQSLDPAGLIYEITGMDLPITDIPNWLQGQGNAFHSEYTEYDGGGNITRTFLHGWDIQYQDYSVDSALPKSITATQDDNALRLVALEWN